MLYCMKHKKFANENHTCDTRDLISLTKDMIPVALKADSIGLQVASAFCLTDNNLVEAGVYFKHIYPDVLLQDLPNGWYLTDYITQEHKVLCSMLAYEYIYKGAKGLDEFVAGIINDLLDYLDTKDKDGLRSILLLLD